MVALDEIGNALRPALIWMDVRANKEADAVLATGDAVGTLTASTAQALGRSQSVKVVQFGVTETPLSAPGVWGAYADVVSPGCYIVEGGQTSTGSIINWLGRLTGSLILTR